MVGEWTPSTPLPSEIELAAHYSASVGTVRRAMDALEDALLITRHQGRGTHIREWSLRIFFDRYYPLRSRDGTSVALEETITKLKVSRLKAAEAAEFGMSEGDAVRRVSRVLMANGSSVISEEAVLPCSVFPNTSSTANEGSLFALSLSAGVALGRASTRVFGVGMQQGHTLEYERIIYTIEGAVAEIATGCVTIPSGYYLESFLGGEEALRALA